MEETEGGNGMGMAWEGELREWWRWVNGEKKMEGLNGWKMGEEGGGLKETGGWRKGGKQLTEGRGAYKKEEEEKVG